MTRTILQLFSLTLLLASMAVSQSTGSFRTLELGGSAWYQDEYLTITAPGHTGDHLRDRRFDINPIVGYFVTPNVQLVSKLSYTMRWNTIESLSSNPYSPSTRDEHHTLQHAVSVGMAVRYNFHVAASLIPFLGIGGNVVFAKSGIAFNDGLATYQPWTSPYFQAPVVMAGTRVLIADAWAVLFEFSYRGFSTYALNPVFSSRAYTFGLGLTTFL